MAEPFDAIVVGFDLAGASAVIEALDCGAKVLILEKAPIPEESGFAPGAAFAQLFRMFYRRPDCGH